MLFNKPIYVHFYLLKKPLDESQRAVLRQYAPFYRALSATRQRYFEHRINRFLQAYQFSGREGLAVSGPMKIRIAAVYVTLTFGMRDYLTKVFAAIIVYPGAFFSKTSNAEHKGEFNPRLRAIVFSWADFESGCDIANDNVNLGIHEFTHALLVHAKTNGGTSATIFIDAYNEMMEALKKPHIMEQLRASGYLRDYAFVNPYEFLSVLLEHYFETPLELRRNLPQLYAKVAVMLNYDPLRR
jgi:Mlc titration factor MtfA (ptsG expression regulator)